MSDPTCKTCKHWVAHTPGYSVPQDWRQCERIRQSDERQSGDTAVTFDPDVNASGLLTAPDFGCVLWEAS